MSMYKYKLDSSKQKLFLTQKLNGNLNKWENCNDSIIIVNYNTLEKIFIKTDSTSHRVTYKRIKLSK